MGVLYLLFESAPGYALFERVAAEEVTPRAEDVTDLKKFSQIVKLKGQNTSGADSAAAQSREQRIGLCAQSAHRGRSCLRASAVSCAAFLPFESAESALENINAVSEGAKTTMQRATQSASTQQTKCRDLRTAPPDPRSIPLLRRAAPRRR